MDTRALIENKNAICAVILIFGVRLGSRYVAHVRLQQKWKAVQCTLRDALTSRVHRCLAADIHVDEALDREILKLEATELVAKMRTGENTCESVMLAYIRRAHKARVEWNCVTEELFDDAWEAAKALDGSRTLINNTDPDLPLLGLPVSVKDCINQADTMSTCGMACRTAVNSEDGLLVALLRKAGAIPFVRTTTPQVLLMSETHSHIWGTTLNPYNKDRTPGGSSGGEGGLVACGGSPLGMGSDIGGSIRIPATFCGICGFKPTPERYTTDGMAIPRANNRNGQQIIRAVAGPLARHVGDCELFMQALSNKEMWTKDPRVPPVPWDCQLAKKGPGRPLRIGVMTSDDWFEPCSAIKRAVLEASQALSDGGHTIVPFIPPVSAWETCRIYYSELAAEGNMHGFIKALEGEPLIRHYAILRLLSRLPNFIRPGIRWILKALGHMRHSMLAGVTRSGGISTRQYWDLIADHMALRKAWLKSISDMDLDIIIMPTSALPALPHGASAHLTPIFSYTFIGNLLHWPAGVVPATHVKETEQFYPEMSDLPKNQRCKLAKFAQAAMKDTKGLPIGVQVMAKPWQDEMCMYAMSEVERCMKMSTTAN